MIDFFEKRRNLGKTGEKIAMNFLKNKNLTFLKKNFIFMRCEIDLIFLNKETRTIIFVEVKTRANKNYGEPEDSVTFYKQRNIQKAAYGFMIKYPKYESYDIRFDIISIMFESEKEYKISHIEEAF